MGNRERKEKRVDKTKAILSVFSHGQRYLISTLQDGLGISLAPGTTFHVQENNSVKMFRTYLFLCT